LQNESSRKLTRDFNPNRKVATIAEVRHGMKEPKIVLVSAYYPPHLGGQEIVVQDLANRLHAAGCSVAVVTSDLGSMKGVTIENGVQVTRLKSFEFSHTAIIWRLFYWLIKNVQEDTIVHLHAGQVFTPEMVWLASKFARFKYILHFHWDLTPSGPMGIFLPFYKKFLLTPSIRNAAVTVTLREDYKVELMREYPDNRGMVVLSNGITEDFYEVPRRHLSGTNGRLLFVGRLSPHKNVTGLLEALALPGSDFGADIIGDGECRDELEKLAASKKLSNVTFHGRLSRREIQEFYSICSAFVLPSFHEQQPMVLLEAMACRAPIITSKVNALSDTIDGAAIIVDPSIQGISDGLKEFARMNPGEIQAMVDRAFERVQKLSWSAVIISYIELYKKVLTG
jgi:glycosyltransferase involved in cell wall biosynthesis